MDAEFKDQFNYLVAFLAVVVGLLVFKDVAIGNYIVLFGVQVSYFALVLPLLASMLLATYLGALTLIVRRWNFTWFPLGKILETTSYGLAAAGLLYPLLVLVSYGLSCIAPFAIAFASDSFAVLVIQVVLTIVQLAALIYVATKYAFSKQKDVTERYIIRANQLEVNINANDKSKDSVSNIFQKYEYLVARAKAYLRTKGYGVAGDNLTRIAEYLHDKDVFSSSDLMKAKRIHNLRNAYAHGIKKPDEKNASRMINIIGKLDAKLDKAFYKLLQEDTSISK